MTEDDVVKLQKLMAICCPSFTARDLLCPKCCVIRKVVHNPISWSQGQTEFRCACPGGPIAYICGFWFTKHSLLYDAHLPLTAKDIIKSIDIIKD